MTGLNIWHKYDARIRQFAVSIKHYKTQADAYLTMETSPNPKVNPTAFTFCRIQSESFFSSTQISYISIDSIQIQSECVHTGKTNNENYWLNIYLFKLDNLWHSALFLCWRPFSLMSTLCDAMYQLLNLAYVSCCYCVQKEFPKNWRIFVKNRQMIQSLDLKTCLELRT